MSSGSQPGQGSEDGPDLARDSVRSVLLASAASIEEALAVALPDLPLKARVGIMPRASYSIPYRATEL